MTATYEIGLNFEFLDGSRHYYKYLLDPVQLSLESTDILCTVDKVGRDGIVEQRIEVVIPNPFKTTHMPVPALALPEPLARPATTPSLSDPMTLPPTLTIPRPLSVPGPLVDPTVPRTEPSLFVPEPQPGPSVPWPLPGQSVPWQNPNRRSAPLPRVPPYPCLNEGCQEFFLTERARDNHIYIHHLNIKRFDCRQCNKSFLKKCDLKIHERVHSDRKRYKCPVCAKTYLYLSRCMQHMDKHVDEIIQTDEKPTCPICEAVHENIAALKLHTYMHLNYQRN